MALESQRRGASWEQALEFVHYRAAREGCACIARVHPPVRVLSKIKQGRFTACWEGNAPPDFIGTVSGVPVCFEAKTTKSRRWSFRNLAPHQASFFDDFERSGGHAFILLQLPNPRHSLMVHWSALGPLWWSWYDPATKAGSPASIDTENPPATSQLIDDGTHDWVSLWVAR